MRGRGVRARACARSSPRSLHPPLSSRSYLVAPPARAGEVGVDVGQGGRVLLLKGQVLLPDLFDALEVRKGEKKKRGGGGVKVGGPEKAAGGGQRPRAGGRRRRLCSPERSAATPPHGPGRPIPATVPDVAYSTHFLAARGAGPPTGTGGVRRPNKKSIGSGRLNAVGAPWSARMLAGGWEARPRPPPPAPVRAPAHRVHTPISQPGRRACHRSQWPGVSGPVPAAGREGSVPPHPAGATSRREKKTRGFPARRAPHSATRQRARPRGARPSSPYHPRPYLGLVEVAARSPQQVAKGALAPVLERVGKGLRRAEEGRAPVKPAVRRRRRLHVGGGRRGQQGKGGRAGDRREGGGGGRPRAVGGGGGGSRRWPGWKKREWGGGSFRS